MQMQINFKLLARTELRKKSYQICFLIRLFIICNLLFVYCVCV